MNNRAAFWSSARFLNRFLALCLWLGASQVAAAELGPETATVGLLELTPAEQAWLRDHPRIQVGNSLDFPPFDFAVSGQLRGYSIDLLDRLAALIGIEIKYINGLSWKDLLERFRQGELDLLHTLNQTPERERFGRFSNAYHRYRNHFVTTRAAPEVTEIRQLFDKRVAVGEGWAIQEYLATHYPQIQLVPLANLAAMLEAVSAGTADALINDPDSTRYMLDKLRIDNLSISGWFKEFDRGENRTFHFMAQPDAPELIAILDKALAILTPEELEHLDRKWFGFLRDESKQVPLSLAEQRFIEHHPEVVLASAISFDPFVIPDSEGRIGGHDVELARLISERTGLRIRFRLGLWDEMQRLAFEREVDGLAPAVNFENRQRFFDASRPYISVSILVFVKHGNPLGIHRVKDLAGRRAGEQKGNLGFERVRQEISGDIETEVVQFGTLTEVIHAVANDRADFAIIDESALYLIRKLGLTRLIESAFVLDQTYDFSFLLRNDWPELRSIIDKGLAAITEPERRELRDYWFGRPIPAPDSAEEALSLSPEEYAYLQRKGRLKLCVDPDWMPYGGLDTEGRHQGMSADFLELFARRLGVELSVHPTRNWSEALTAARLRHCDLIELIKSTPERRAYLDFTAPYLSFPYVVATRNDEFFIEDIEHTLDETFVVVRGYAVTDELRRRYPAIRLLEVETIRDGLEKVRDGEVFGYIGATATVAYTLERYGIRGVKVAGRLPGGFDLGMATRNDEPLLGQVFRKAVDSLTPEQKRRIRDKWLAIDVQRVTDYTLLWWVLSAAAMLLTLFAYWNRQLQRSRQQTEQALNELNKTQHQLEQQYRQLEWLSVTDHLTQIHNRAKLDEVLEREIRRAGRDSIGLGVIMVDVDYFKLVNDTYGHQAGDQVLVAIAELLQHRVRAIDIVGRWGGEEFLVLCPSTDREGVQTLAEHLRVAVAEHAFPVVGHKTASFGIATYRSADSVESLVARADRALYAAKANGRNRVEEAPEAEPAVELM